MVTIKDIARELNLSHSVVSRALNPNPDPNARVSPATRQLVEDTARRLGFRRNRIAEFMKRGRAATIGVFLPEYSNRLTADLMMGISEEAAGNGFPLNFYFGLSYQSYAGFIRNNIKNPSSGFISYPFNIDPSDNIGALFREYHAAGGKAILLNAPPRQDPALPVLYMDETVGTRAAADCLVAGQCARYLVTTAFAARFREFQAYLSAGDCRAIASSDLPAILRQHRDGRGHFPVGVFATTDEDAMRCLRYIREAGMEPGREVLLVGYDDLQLTALTDPPLTTIHQPFRQQGRRAVAKLINTIYGNPEADEAVTPFLVKRATA